MWCCWEDCSSHLMRREWPQNFNSLLGHCVPFGGAFERWVGSANSFLFKFASALLVNISMPVHPFVVLMFLCAAIYLCAEVGHIFAQQTMLLLPGLLRPGPQDQGPILVNPAHVL
ncbi:hypothetical protein DUNSADRAFT_2268 [Dunaliella salina]|uniref:Uncharacterized protein n=1 Tax=Dunaliella salina TaxID=3046 RepID=A0ABQ7FWH8_DUNSA|nr:hypothetical protein DUNSADRAFT_2268 [Dunaliella salina]|eukprot:KAF5826716.1 hypothetical protein DUNSADRAFT_2268 [Dunaliella salina]